MLDGAPLLPKSIKLAGPILNKLLALGTPAPDENAVFLAEAFNIPKPVSVGGLWGYLRVTAELTGADSSSRASGCDSESTPRAYRTLSVSSTSRCW